MEFYFYNTKKLPIKSPNAENNPSMLDYFREIDPIALKYQNDVKSELSPRAKGIAARYEINHQFGNLSKQEYSYMMENLRLVYGVSNPEVEKDIEVYHLIEKKIINGYLGIPELSRIFDEDYFNFEWDMHVGQNFNEHRNDYYRDHFIHQIRNLYMMMNVLTYFSFDQAISHIFHQQKASRISEYVFKSWRMFKYRDKEEKHNLLKDIVAEENLFKRQKITEEAYCEQYFFKYVIYASSIIAALFHDMGYPICHFLELRHRTSAYNPAMYMFTHNAVESFDQLSAKLSGSLLFTIVSQEEIRQRLEPQKGNKYDHGVYSAIAFLLQFYETGMIYSLGPEEKCAVEMAALAIYNHTGKFRSINRKAETNQYALMFFQNPIAFLLRFCDDLQEWDRRYFEISEASDFMFCQLCGLPLIRSEKHNKTDGNDSVTSVSHYSCGCKDPLIRPNIFYKRKLYLVTVADWVRFSFNERGDHSNNLQVTIRYDLYKLLILSVINNTYAKYRLKDLKDVEKLVACQNFNLMSNGILPIQNIEIQYFMSANPIRIKVKILEEYLANIDYSKSEAKKRIRETPLNQQQILQQISNILKSQSEQDSFLQSIKCSEDEFPPTLISILVKEKILHFYLRLLFIQIAARSQNLTSEVKRLAKTRKTLIIKCIRPRQVSDQQYYKAISLLIDDCLCPVDNDTSKKAARWIFNTPQGKDIDPDRLYQQIKVFTDSRNYFNDYYDSYTGNNSSPRMIGFYKDLYFFYLMNEEIRCRE